MKGDIWRLAPRTSNASFSLSGPDLYALFPYGDIVV